MALSVALALTAGACAEEPRPRRQDSPNPPTRGVIEIPANDQTVRPLTVVSGWAVDESGVERVRIYGDDGLLATVRVTGPRPDVEKALPEYSRPGARHGWTAEVDFGAKLGHCLIRAEALDGRGALTHFASVAVRIVP
jgi:hypothetical protein